MAIAEILLHELAPDVGFLIGGSAADGISTFFGVKKFGYESESINHHREQMQKQDTAKYIIKDTAKDFACLTLIAGAAYMTDYFFGINDQTLNLHHAFAYGIGGLKYTLALGNSLRVMGYHRIANIVHFPVEMFLRISDPKNRYHI